MKLSEHGAAHSCKNLPQYNARTSFSKETLSNKLDTFFFPQQKIHHWLLLETPWDTAKFLFPKLFYCESLDDQPLTYWFQVSQTRTACRLSQYITHLQKHLLDLVTTENTLLVQDDVHQQKEQFWSPKKMIKTLFLISSRQYWTESQLFMFQSRHLWVQVLTIIPYRWPSFFMFKGTHRKMNTPIKSHN